MKNITKQIITGVAFSLIISASAEGNDFSMGRYQKLNICAPYNAMISDIQNEMDTLNPAKVQTRIQKVSQAKKAKISDISNKKSKFESAANHLGKLQSRLVRLSNHMDQEVALLKGQIAKAEQNMVKAKQDIVKNQKKKDDCRGGILGSLCRKKYRSRIKDAEKDLKRAQDKKIATMKKLNNLPSELQALPGKIAGATENLEFLQSELVAAQTAKPTVADLEQKIQSLNSQLDSIQNELDALKEDLLVAQDSKAKCVHMRKLANAYPVLQDHAEVFKKNPELCNNVDNMVNMAQKPAHKKGIIDAHQIVCIGQINNGGGEGDDQQDDHIIHLDKVIESPLGSNGEYPDNFRNSDYQPKFIDKVGGSDIQQIKFTVDFDIEQHYDYLLIKDSNGQEIEKIDGQGQKEIIVDSSEIQIFFYSDGRTAGKGFTIDQIELIK